MRKINKTKLQRPSRVYFIILFLTLISSLSSQVNTINIDIDLSSDLYNQRSEWNKKIDKIKIVNTIYVDLDFISNGVWKIGYVEGRPMKDENGYYDYYYRCVVVQVERFDLVLLEKIASTHEDGMRLELTNQMVIPLWSFVESNYPKIYNNWIHSSYSIKTIEWLGKTKFQYYVKGIKIICSIVE